MKTFEIDPNNPIVKAPHVVRPLNILLLIVCFLFSPIAYLMAIICCVANKLPITGMWETIWKDVEETYKEAFCVWVAEKTVIIDDQQYYITIHNPTWKFWFECILIYAFIIGVALFFKEYKIDCEDAAIAFRCFKER